MPRPSRDELFLRVAGDFALRSTCARGQVGCVAVVDDHIVSTGYNGSPPGTPHCLDVGCKLGHDGGCIRATHAEMNCVAFSARIGASLRDAALYCTHACCEKCAALVVAAGIVRVVYAKPYRLTEGVELLDKCNVEVMQYGYAD
jgi:dCMP deaminase